MTAAILQFIAAAAVVIFAGAALARAAERIADITGFGRLLVGSVLLAGATSLPELAVDISAVRAGLDDVAVGDLLGSSLFNLLILAIADLAHKRRGVLLTRLSRAHLLSGLSALMLTALVGVFIVVRPEQPLAFGGIGVGSVVVAVAYVLCVRLVYRDQRIRGVIGASHDAVTAAGAAAGAADDAARRPKLAPQLGVFAGAALVILVAAPFVAQAAGEIAELSGLGGTFVGTTLVAASTSLPELVATLAAVRMGSFDLAVGNVFGSNTFNMAMILPIDAFSEGPLLGVVAPAHAVTAFAVTAITAVALMGIAYEDDRRRRFIEPDAVAIIALVLSALGLLYFVR
jgi:cation:H+ antiporter